MNLSTLRRTLLAATIGAAFTLAGPAVAQDKWPSKPITYVVPFPAGGTTDVLARLIAQKLGPALGTTVVVENRAGAGGNIGSDFVRRRTATPFSAAPSAHTPST